MKLLFKQKFFSWLDSYDVFDENGNTVFIVKGQLSWGHCLKIYDVLGNELGTVKEKIFTFLPKFEMYEGENYIGCISKEFTFFKPRFNVDCKGWYVDGDFFEWEYDILSYGGIHVASVSKELFNFTDTYSINVSDDADALVVLMLVIAIDAEKCSRDN
ncbi:MAG: hypothetical protein E7623_02855 [Ruminococcaceae bacterium]|nr:hypothetical protein [Oscillospiraceae bacterium]